jgi:hypothetical protein
MIAAHREDSRRTPELRFRAGLQAGGRIAVDWLGELYENVRAERRDVPSALSFIN